jgi:hypothetical protein
MLRYIQVLTTGEGNVSKGLETGTIKPERWPVVVITGQCEALTFKNRASYI